jgi:hypothetical protein
MTNVLLILAVLCGCSVVQKPVRIDTEPDGASIYVNGEYIGTAPCTYTIVDDNTPGVYDHYTIQASLDGYITSSKLLKDRTGSSWIPSHVLLRLEPADSSGQAFQSENAAALSSLETLKIRVIGLSNAAFDGKQTDRKEAILDAKRQAVEKAGVSMKSQTVVRQGVVDEDFIESQAETYILPGYEIVDIGYDQDEVTYQVVLIGAVRVRQ